MYRKQLIGHITKLLAQIVGNEILPPFCFPDLIRIHLLSPDSVTRGNMERRLSHSKLLVRLPCPLLLPNGSKIMT